MGNLLIDREAIWKPDVLRIVYLGIAGGAYVVTELGRRVYRPYVYRNGIDDYGLADTIGNLTGVVVQIFLVLAILNSDRKYGPRVIVFITVGFIVYEFLQPVLPKGVYDVHDVAATLIGGLVSLVLFFAIQLGYSQWKKSSASRNPGPSLSD